MLKNPARVPDLAELPHIDPKGDTRDKAEDVTNHQEPSRVFFVHSLQLEVNVFQYVIELIGIQKFKNDHLVLVHHLILIKNSLLLALIIFIIELYIRVC